VQDLHLSAAGYIDDDLRTELAAAVRRDLASFVQTRLVVAESNEQRMSRIEHRMLVFIAHHVAREPVEHDFPFRAPLVIRDTLRLSGSMNTDSHQT
jgi:hypothetical protein